MIVNGKKFILTSFFAFKPAFKEELAFVLVMTDGSLSTCFHTLTNLFGLKTFMVFFDGLFFSPVNSSFFPGFFTDLAVGL